MATFRDGILGGFKGLVGTVIGSTWRGLNVMKKRPKPSSKKPVQKQIDQRSKFGLMTGLLGHAHDQINEGFDNTGVLTPMNRAVQYNIARAIQGTSPKYSIDYSKVVISKGNLPDPAGFTISFLDDEIVFKWSAFEGEEPVKTERDKDLLRIFTYHPATNKTVKTFIKTERSKLTFSLGVPTGLIKGEFHVWVYWISADLSSVSTSIHLGPIIIP